MGLAHPLELGGGVCAKWALDACQEGGDEGGKGKGCFRVPTKFKANSCEDRSARQ